MNSRVPASFHLEATDSGSRARAGVLRLSHGDIPTPIFMPVGTVGTVKGIDFTLLEEGLNAPIILGNTYHLYLRPGLEVMREAGGFHGLTSWQRPVLTDSGGYQVYSLADRRKLTEEGAWFHSHIDGSRHLFSPERVMEIQRIIGADIMMAFDECTPYPCDPEYARTSMELTHRWLDRCLAYAASSEPLYGHHQQFFPIVQGSTFLELRKISAETIASKGAFGHAIGGLSVGEPAEEMYAMVDCVNQILPRDRPRYLMGVGTPANLLECIALGIDMFDCVMPTRNGRNGMMFTRQGIIHIRNKKWERDFSPIDPDSSYSGAQRYSKAYLRHLFQAQELLGLQIASLQNLHLYLWLVRTAREKIIEGTFVAWKNSILPTLMTRL